MAKQGNIGDIVRAAYVSGTDSSTYRPNNLGKVGKTVVNSSLLAMVGLSYFLTACNSTTVSAKTPSETSVPAKTATQAIVTQEPTAAATYTETPAATYTTSPTVTPELYAVSFQAFHDYNGNGTKEEGEPVLEGILNKTSAGECTTGTDGTCEIVGVPAGEYKISVTDNRDVETFEKMKYILPSLSEIKNLKNPLKKVIHSDNRILLPLASGWLTTPLDLEHSIFSYFDLLQSAGVKNFKGEKIIAAWPNKPGTLENHRGIDYTCKKGDPIYATAPGTVVYAGKTGNGSLMVGINHMEDAYQTGYGHLDTIKVNLFDDVQRGDIIGTCGSTGTSIVHLHFQVECLKKPCNGSTVYYDDGEMDPFRELSNNSSTSLWTQSNQPSFYK
jgi:murein DD-endopeptidase MepM/ murein hydrolase activator NlpD